MTTKCSQLRRVRGFHWTLGAACVAMVAVVGCDAGDDADPRLADLLDDDLLDDDLLDDDLLDDDLEGPVRTPFDREAFEVLSADPAALQDAVLAAETVGDVLTLLPPQALPEELLERDLHEPIAIGLPDDEAAGTNHFLPSAADPLNIGEAACASVGFNAINGAAVSATTGVATSPNANYTSASCPNQFITEVSGTYGKSFDIVARFASPPTTQATCSYKNVNVTSYGRRYVFTGVAVIAVWDTIRTTALAYKWIKPYGLPAKCVLMPQGTAQPHVSNSQYHRIRTATQAYRWSFLGFAYQRVTAGIDL